jgi:hypothetical protein
MITLEDDHRKTLIKENGFPEISGICMSIHER